MNRTIVATALSGVLVLNGAQALAADTVEPFDEGAADVEVYGSADNLGPRGQSRGVGVETMLGLGVVERLSLYVAGAHETDETFAGGESSGSLGMLSTPYESDHFDIDLTLDFSIPRAGFGDSAVSPGLELNFDLDPDMESVGFYTRAAEVFASREEVKEPEGAGLTLTEPRESRVFAPSTEVTAGTYWSVASGHQVLLEYSMAFAHNAAEGEDTVDLGAVALGYNVTLADGVELINQVAVGIPKDGETAAAVGSGLIVGFPTPGWTPSTEVAKR